MAVLPAGDHLQIDPRKLIYLLTSGKARFFISHGFSPTWQHELDAALRLHTIRNQVEDVCLTVHGVKFIAKAVRRLRDPLQRSAIGAVEAALRCLGKRVEVTVLDAA